MRRLPYALALATMIMAPKIVFAAPVEGGLIKTASESAVYYHGPDGKRYAFPNDKVYFSWYADFSGVATVTAEDLAAIPLGGNVTARPGVRMVKIATDSKTYAVDRGGLLRWVKTEAAARALYGDDWNRKIDDVEDAFFVNYRLGTPIETAADFNPAAATASAATIGADKSALPAPGPVQASGAPTVTVSLPPDAANQTVVRGALDAPLGSFAFAASAEGPATMTTVDVQGYLDIAEGDGDFGAGSDEDASSPTYLKALVPYAYLYDGSKRIAGPVDVSVEGKVRFSGLSVQIPAGTSKTLLIKGDVSKTADLGAQPDRIAFDIVDAATGVVAVATDGKQALTLGHAPNGGLAPKSFTTIKAGGTLAVGWAGAGGNVIAGRTVEVGTLTFEAKEDSYEVRTVSLSVVGQQTSLAQLRLDYLKPGGAVVMAAAGSENAFGGLGLAVPAGQKIQIKVLGDLRDRVGGAVSGQKLKISLLAPLPFEAVSKTTGQVYRETDAGGGVLSFADAASEMTVRFTTLKVAKLPDTPTGPLSRSGEASALRFSLTSAVDGTARVRSMAFKIVPSDAGTNGADNDALERWADMNGDVFDDNEVVTLRQPASPGGEVVGEDFKTSLTYGIYHAGAEDTTPQGLDSAAGDYAVVRYVFSDGFEMPVPAGQTLTFQIDVRADKLALGAQSLTVELLGGADFAWIDTGVGSPTSYLDAASVDGFPVKTDVLSVP